MAVFIAMLWMSGDYWDGYDCVVWMIATMQRFGSGHVWSETWRTVGQSYELRNAFTTRFMLSCTDWLARKTATRIEALLTCLQLEVDRELPYSHQKHSIVSCIENF